MNQDRDTEPAIFQAEADPEEVPAEGAGTPPEPEVLFFESVEVFVTEYLSQVIRRRLNRAVALWCPKWWAHPEAVARLTSIWRAFEYLRKDPALGMSVWWLHHADPHLRALMDPDFGPFGVCDPREGHNNNPLDGLPLVAVPPGLLDHPGFRVEESLFAEMKAKETHGSSTHKPRTGYPKDKVLNKNIGF
ncbi:DUF4913 domain-containing protein [Embleya sp. NPDC056575]|uniref:DUF4913 domain-containing protein n=1 Tax=unclassified Embleya TaxID=2699296 RepID=UPI0036770B0F